VLIRLANGDYIDPRIITSIYYDCCADYGPAVTGQPTRRKHRVVVSRRTGGPLCVEMAGPRIAKRYRSELAADAFIRDPARPDRGVAHYREVAMSDTIDDCLKTLFN
jgi:hypothetical protein